MCWSSVDDCAICSDIIHGQDAASAGDAERAMVRDPDILILDEATNAVDGWSEAAIVETLKSSAGRRKTIVISHHHSTISFCGQAGHTYGPCRIQPIASRLAPARKTSFPGRAREMCHQFLLGCRPSSIVVTAQKQDAYYEGQNSGNQPQCDRRRL
ncbi:MAG: hypothetical protein EOQ42_04385 [Mesorhizobium sp.]|nr:MAG: hypothetical protein EOQ43_10340 [Mesorhizobium sp.]RWB80534.1 MAG: hypothetical protein EOQ42_04385 [Mesorhizobium sp.]RWD22083.1 MAG: hypothetical protein EOS57_04220 [Mesorhizobium sp.]